MRWPPFCCTHNPPVSVTFLKVLSLNSLQFCFRLYQTVCIVKLLEYVLHLKGKIWELCSDEKLNNSLSLDGLN